MFEKGLPFLEKLIGANSITPNDCGLQGFIYQYLKGKLHNDYDMTLRDCSANQTTNSHITVSPKGYKANDDIGFIGHTDVVPAQSENWSSHPFSLHHINNRLYGRGLVDMKGAIACFIEALLIYLESIDRLEFNIHLFLTSDEEGTGEDGLQRIFEGYIPSNFLYAIVGEPTSDKTIGDFIKTGRRGSVHGDLELLGEQYHVAYPGPSNPFDVLGKVIQNLQQTNFTEESLSVFTESNLEITKISCDPTVENIIPGKISIRFNIRNTPSYPLHSIEDSLNQLLKKDRLPCRYQLKFRQGGEPWLTSLSQEYISTLLPHKNFQYTTQGGLSDGWKAHRVGLTQLFELGLKNATAHQHNESTTIEDLCDLTELYHGILEQTKRR